MKWKLFLVLVVLVFSLIAAFVLVACDDNSETQTSTDDSKLTYNLMGDMLPKEGVIFSEGDDLMQIYQSSSGLNEKIGNGSVVIEFKDKNGKIVSGAAPRSNVTATLKEVVIGNNVSSIPDNAFKGCTSLKSVTIPDSVTSIGSYAFDGCTLEIKWGNNPTIETISSYAFSGYKGTSITIPASVTSIGGYAFKGCTVEINWGNNPTIETISSYAFSGYKGTSITIPASVMSIGSYAFDGCTAEINWGNDPTIETIGSYAFSGYRGTSITIPDSVTSIGEYAFYDCNSLKSVNIPYSVMNIGNKAFFNSQNTTTVYIAFPSSPSGWNSSWYGNGIKIVYDKTVTSSSNNNFNYYVLNDGIYITKYIGSETVVEIPGYIDGKKVLGLDAIFESNTTVTSVTIPDGVANIPYRMFYECTSLTSVTIPDSVTSIGSSAFRVCTSLTSVTIGDGVTCIGDEAFYGCSNITDVYYTSDIASWLNIDFVDYNSNPISYGGNLYINGQLLINLVIPDGITSIGDRAFDGCTSLTSVTIGNGVTSIGDYAFYDCTSLTSVTIPDSVTSIGDYAFYDCSSLTSVTIGDSVTSIGDYAFSRCNSLTSVTIPDGVTSIGDSAFSNCSSLTSVTIGNSVTSIGSGAFSNCTSLTIYCEAASKPSGWDNNWNYSDCPVVWDANNSDVADDGYIYYTDENGLRYTLKDTNATVVRQAENLSGNIEIPASVSYKGITYSVTSIGSRAFYYCTSLTSVTIGNGVTSIGDYAFSGCPSLIIYCEAASKPSGWNNYWNSNDYPVVWDANNSDVADDGYIYYIDENGLRYALKDTTATVVRQAENLSGNIEIPASVSFKGITYSVTSIGSRAFYRCTSLTSVTIGNGVTSIGSSAFEDCDSLQRITLPFVENPLGFLFGALDYVHQYRDIPHSLYIVEITGGNICDYAFFGCTSLTSVTIPDSVTSIGYDAFRDCDSLDDVYYTSDIASWLNISFSGGTANPLNNGANLYLNGELATDVVIPGNVTSIGDYAFSGCTSLTSVTIGNGVTSIGYYAFDGCTSLTSVTIPDSVTSIGDRAFARCSSLETITVDSGNSVYHSAGNCLIETATKTLIAGCKNSVIPDDGSVTSIGDYAFSRCNSLTSVTIPDGVTSIGDSAFSNCSSLTSVTIPDSVTSIGDWAFSHCDSLTSVTIPDSVTSIGYSAFYNCDSLTSVTIPDSVTSIGGWAFDGCTSLTSVTIPDSVTSIGYRAFYNCTSLTSVTFEGTVAQWNEIEKIGSWYYNTPFTKVDCSDGTVRV